MQEMASSPETQKQRKMVEINTKMKKTKPDGKAGVYLKNSGLENEEI